MNNEIMKTLKTSLIKEEIAGFQHYLQAHAYTAGTRQNWANCLVHYLAYPYALGQERERVLAFFAHLETLGHSASYLNKYRQVIRAYYRWQGERGQPGVAVMEEIPRFAGRSVSHPVLSPQEITLLYEACESDALGIRDKAVLALCYGCGLRRAEAVSLNVADLRMRSRVLTVQKGKGNRQRYVPVSTGVVADLEDYLQHSRESFQPRTQALLINIHGQRANGSAIAGRFKRLCQKAGLQKEAGLHSLRHSIATHLLAEGMSLENIARFLGHASLSSTQIYTHLSNDK